MGSDPRVDEVLEILARMEAKLDAVVGVVLSTERRAPTSNGGEVADDAELDSQYGNPEVRFNPKRWEGESQIGNNFSECPSDYLNMLADTLDWIAGQQETKNELTKQGKPRAPYTRKDAARARGHAARNARKEEE